MEREARQQERQTPRHPALVKWLLAPVGASALLITAQALTASPGSQQGASAPAPALTNTIDARLNPTAHPPVPATLAAMWYVRDPEAPPPTGALANLARGVQILDEMTDPAEALSLVSAPALLKTDVADYARYYTGLALQRLGRLDEADASFAALVARGGEGQLFEAAAYRQAEIRETRGDFAAAAAIYDTLLTRKLASPQIALVKLGSVASSAGDKARAIDAHRRVLREFPLSAEAAEADQLLERLDGFALETPAAVSQELNRAELLFKTRKWDQARTVYERVRSHVEGVDRDRLTLRLAQVQAATGQHRQVRDVFRRYVTHDVLGAEAHYGLIVAARQLGDDAEFVALTRDFVARHPTHTLAEEALNELARHYILEDEDGKAAAVYAQMVERFPSGAFAERATWKAGWWAYREKNFRETVRLYEHGAATFPRSDYRPSWLYWSARAYDHLGDDAAATGRYRLAATDYLNTYYGRLAWRQLEERDESTMPTGLRGAIVTPAPPPPTAPRITRLIELGLYRPALNELQYAQKVWGDSPAIQATIAFVHNKMGNFRLGITAMKRAYPQYMAAGGEDLPLPIQHVLFPVDYWGLLKGNAQAQGLDPYVIAALVAQESTFDAAIRSSANAVGLMQLLPSTGRRYAKKVGMRSFSERALTNPEINVRLGTQYYSDLIERFEGHHFALASYNAGEHRVQRWLNEVPGLPQDEWIDNIPFPETQNYVKRILGTADDYRRLYGEGQPTATARAAQSKAKPAVRKSTTTKRPPAKAPTKKKAPPKKTPARKSTSAK
jgi:soluble lytic murein transglycosylase